MAKRRSTAEQERIRAEVRKSMLHPAAPAQLVRMKLSCGHEENVKPGLDPVKAICSQCRQAAFAEPGRVQHETIASQLRKAIAG